MEQDVVIGPKSVAIQTRRACFHPSSELSRPPRALLCARSSLRKCSRYHGEAAVPRDPQFLAPTRKIFQYESGHATAFRMLDKTLLRNGLRRHIRGLQVPVRHKANSMILDKGLASARFQIKDNPWPWQAEIDRWAASPAFYWAPGLASKSSSARPDTCGHRR